MATAPKITAIRPPAASDTAKLAELAALVQKIREDVRATHAPQPSPEISVPNLEPLLQARDAVNAHVDAIGRVNPRQPGLANNAIQFAKRAIARSLNWFIRDQITFNHEVVGSLNATIVALQESNQALQATLDAASVENQAWARRLQAEFRRLEDANTNFQDGLGQRQDHFELIVKRDFQSAIADHRAAVDQAALAMDAKAVKAARDFEKALADTTIKIQDMVWSALAKTRQDYDALIHSELRMTRQRAALPEVLPASISAATNIQPAAASLQIDWLKFAEKFRGSEAHVSRSLEIYAEAFADRAPVIDLGCGRGEFLELMRGKDATGIEASPELVAICRSKGLKAECADAFSYLEACTPGSLGGIFCSQMLEHIEPAGVIRLIRLAHRALRPGGLLALETPNPECLAIFATHFYLDPSHTRPIPPALMAFHMEEAGFGSIRIERLHPAIESMPTLAALPEDFCNAFFGSLDYAAFGVKL